MKNINVMIADDHTLVREGLVALLTQESDIDVVCQTGEGHEAIDLAKQHQPQVAILDVGMPGLNGIEVAKRIQEASPGTRVLAISMHNDGRYVRGMVDAGARGYILKNSASKELVKGVRRVAEGRQYFSMGVGYVESNDNRRTPTLTKREREVLQLIVEGNRTTEIADMLSVAVKTVEAHRRNIMNKLQIDSVPGLVKYALREGIITLDT